MVLFGYGKEKIYELQAEIKSCKADIVLLEDKIKSLKGYVYAKKIHIDEEKSEDLNIGLPAIPLNDLFQSDKRFER
jgi:hypothetical protein